MREKLKALDKCDACLTSKTNHEDQCTKTRFPWAYCRSYLHETITCDGGTHPGSWILNDWKLAAVSEITPAFNSNLGIESEAKWSKSEIAAIKTKGDFSICGLIVMDIERKTGKKFQS